MSRPVAPLVTLGLAVLTVALILVGLPLIVAPARTERSFSWTIDVPLTAAFLGTCYWTAALFTLLSAREREWARVRTVLPGVLVAGTLILVATLVHIDRFAMDTARGWIWLILYACLPPGGLLLLALQRRVGGTDPPVDRPIEPWAAALLAVAAATFLIAGAALFAVPGTTGEWWPWPLTPLTARMVGAWLAAIGATLVGRAARGRLVTGQGRDGVPGRRRRRPPGNARRLFRHRGWGDAAAWLYLALCAALLALAVRGRAQLELGSARTAE